MKRPSFQFYPGDWLTDMGLRMCSPATRGLWADMLCLMHQGSTYGYLEVNLAPILPHNLANLVGFPVDEVSASLDELERNGVLSRDERGCIFSRRMVRDEKVRAARAAGGSLGGNPQLIHKDQGSAKVGKKVNLSPNLQPTPSSSSSSSSSINTPLPPRGGKQRGEKKPPPTFEVTAELKAWADEKVPGLDVAYETEKFKDWEFKAARTDWDATWRTWMRKAHESRNGSTQRDLGGFDV